MSPPVGSRAAYLAANDAWLVQWIKFDKALANGVTGAPLLQIDRKLTRLQSEMEDAEDAWRSAGQPDQ